MLWLGYQLFSCSAYKLASCYVIYFVQLREPFLVQCLWCVPKINSKYPMPLVMQTRVLLEFWSLWQSYSTTCMCVVVLYMATGHNSLEFLWCTICMQLDIWQCLLSIAESTCSVVLTCQAYTMNTVCVPCTIGTSFGSNLLKNLYSLSHVIYTCTCTCSSTAATYRCTCNFRFCVCVCVLHVCCIHVILHVQYMFHASK